MSVNSPEFSEYLPLNYRENYFPPLLKTTPPIPTNAKHTLINISESNLSHHLGESLQRLVLAKQLSLNTKVIPAAPCKPERIHRNWGKGLITKAQAFEKMKKNIIKAVTEHFSQFNNSQQKKYFENPYPASIEKFIDKINEKSNDVPSRRLKVSAGYSSNLGPRPSMDDVHFCMPLPGSILTAVLDGHGGKDIASFAKSVFKHLFPDILKKHKGNVHQAFEEIFRLIQTEAIKIQAFDTSGSTVVISYFDKSTNLIYTATLGDSEANIYRNIEGEYKSIPLSCLRNWESKRDELRASQGTAGDYRMDVVEYWKKNHVSVKHRRINEKNQFFVMQHFTYGLNVSRAFGDQIYNRYRAICPIIAKPKITIFYVEPGDILVFACDGLKDYVPEPRIVDCVKKFMNESAETISNKIVELALAHKTKDNVTVLTMKFD